jgi:DNA-directed RNA polymerase subunit H (RpoH/RPB5)
MEEHNSQVGELLGIRSTTVEGVVGSHGRIDSEELKRILKTIKENRYPFDVIFMPDHPLSAIEAYYGDAEGYVRNSPKRCHFIWHMTTVYPDGSVTPCLNYPAGSILHRPFLKIWNGPQFRRFRCVVKRHGYFPACHRCCNS